MNIIERIQKTSWDLWRNAQEKREIMAEVIPHFQRIIDSEKTNVKDADLGLENAEMLLQGVMDQLNKIRDLNKEESRLNSELGTAYGKMLELDFDSDRNDAAHLATFTKNFPVWIVGDSKLWSYMMGLGDVNIMAEAFEDQASTKLRLLRLRINKILDIRDD